MKQWFLIQNQADYNHAIKRYETIRNARKGTTEHKEKLLLAFLINQYEQKLWSIPEVDPIEVIKIRMEDFGYKSLLTSPGDKGTINN